jgi:hypothetical protein
MNQNLHIPKLCSKTVLTRILWAFLAAVLVCPLSGDQRTETEPATGELIRNVELLRDLDAGDLKSARRRLNADSMVRIFTIMESVGFATNKDILCSEPGLRAAARYWGKGRSLPPGLLTLEVSYPVVSNQIADALRIVRSELDAGARSRTNKPPAPNQQR